jgi:dihydropteroate synthase
MHTRGKPDEWSRLAAPADVVLQVKRELRDRAEIALLAGVRRDRIVLDPGFGFGKKLEENYPLLKRFSEFHELRFPLLAGVSRKGFLGRTLARGGHDAGLEERSSGTLAAETIAMLMGAHLIRTHDVGACADASRIADCVLSY